MENQAHDIQLIQKCRAKDDQAFTTLSLKYQPLMISKMQHYHIPTMDFDDLLQECRIVLYQAVQKYKLDSSIRFSSFYMYLLKHHFCELIRYYRAYKRRGECDLADMAYNDYLIEERYSEGLNLEQIVEVRERFEQAYELLTDTERNIFYQNQTNKYFMAYDKRIKNILYRSQYKMRKQLK